MSFTIPADFASIVKAVIAGAGDDVVWTPQDGGTPVALRGSVQRPGTSLLTGDAIQEGYVVFVAGDAFGAIQPARFDRLLIAGHDRSVEEVVPIQAGNEVLAWQLRVLG